MVAIKCQHLTVSVQLSLRQKFLSVIRTITAVNLKWLLVNSGILKAGYWRDRGLEEQGLGVSSQVCSKPEHCGEIQHLFFFLTEIGNQWNRNVNSVNWLTIKARFFFYRLHKANFVKRLFTHLSYFFAKESHRAKWRYFSFLQKLAVGHIFPQWHSWRSKVRGIMLFSLLHPFSFSGHLFQDWNNPNKFSSADIFLSLQNLDISVCYNFSLEQKQIHFFSVPARNKRTSAYEHEPADKTTDMGHVGKGHRAFDLTTAQLLSSTPGNSPVISSRENCLSIFM